MRKSLFILSVFFVCSPVSASESAGTGGAAFLAIPIGVRSMGMGDAGVAVPSGVNGAHLNPASLTRLRKKEASFSYQDIFGGLSLGFIGAAKPLSYRGVSELGGATLFTDLVYFNKGQVEVNRLKADGSLESSNSTSAGYDLAIAIGYAENFFKGNFGIQALPEGIHSLGLTLKGIHSSLASVHSAQAISADIGYLGDFKRFALGFSLANLGTKLKFIEVGDPLPVVFRSGFSFKKDISLVHLRFAMDVIHQEDSLREHFGVEASFAPGAFLRAGWRFEPKSFQGGPAIGFGYDNEDLFVDYAFNWFGDLRDTHRLLIGTRFGSTLR